MDCDLCGRQDALVNAIVEGSAMKVCRNCARFGHVIALEKPAEVIKEEKRKKARLDLPKEYIVDNYGELIKLEREKIKLTQSELALRINEKESIIHKLESYYLEPSFGLAQKLEKFLGIRLIYSMEDPLEKKKMNFKDDSITIADIMKMRK